MVEALIYLQPMNRYQASRQTEQAISKDNMALRKPEGDRNKRYHGSVPVVM
jgi:hypothetical protein